MTDQQNDAIELYRLAHRHKRLLCCLLGLFLGNVLFGIGKLGYAPLIVIGGALYFVSLVGVFVYVPKTTAAAGGGTGLAIAHTIAMIFPIVNLLVLLSISNLATKKLASKGLKVGFMGLSGSSMRQLGHVAKGESIVDFELVDTRVAEGEGPLLDDNPSRLAKAVRWHNVLRYAILFEMVFWTVSIVLSIGLSDAMRDQFGPELGGLFRVLWIGTGAIRVFVVPIAMIIARRNVVVAAVCAAFQVIPFLGFLVGAGISASLGKQLQESGVKTGFLGAVSLERAGQGQADLSI